MTTWKIVCDFDGTIAVDDVTDTLLERFGLPGWQDIEAEWLAGRIGSRECMARQIALLDASRDELDALLATTAIDPAFPAFTAAARAAGMELEIVSDGIDYAIHSILDRHHLGSLPIIANELKPTGTRRWRLAFPHADPDCGSGTCKCRRAGLKAGADRKMLVIGDGRSDFCVAAQADMVFAKNKLVEHCRVAGIDHVPIGGFAEALMALSSIGELVQPAQPPRIDGGHSHDAERKVAG